MWEVVLFVFLASKFQKAMLEPRMCSIVLRYPYRKPPRVTFLGNLRQVQAPRAGELAPQCKHGGVPY